MQFLKRALSRVKGLFTGGAMEKDMDKEMRLHLDLLVQQFERSGMSRDEADEAARRQFGNTLLIKERGRDIRGAGVLGDILQDVRYAARTFRHNPIFTAVIVLSLALGIGANTALFSLLDAKLLRKLPVQNPDQLVWFGWLSNGWSPGQVRGGVVGGRDFKRSAVFSKFAFDQFHARSATLSDVFAAGQAIEASAGIDGQAEPVTLQLTSGNYYTALGVPAAAGRIFTVDDDQASHPPVAVISHRFWQRRFGQSTEVVGKKVFLNGMQLTIIGVAPPGFLGIYGASAPNFSIPMAFASGIRAWNSDAEQNAWWLNIVGRMRPGISYEQVRGELEGVLQGVALASTGGAALPGVLRLETKSASRGLGFVSQDNLQILIVLGLVFASLLLIVCLNVASMLLARAAARQYEVGVRLAMGAGRLRLIRQLLTENVLMAFIGGALGALLAYWAKDLFMVVRRLGEDLDLRIDVRVLAFCAVVSLLSGILFGLAPALRATRMDVSSAVKRTVQSAGIARSPLTTSVLIAQVAISAVLLMGAGLFLRTMGVWRSMDPGFDAANMLVFRVNPETLSYGEARKSALYEQLIERIRSIPVVTAATMSDNFWSLWGPVMRIPGEPRFRMVRALPIRPNFFDVMGLRVLAGRAFTPADGRGAPLVAVIDEVLAQRYFPNLNPIGRRFGLAPSGGDDIQIVGIVSNMTIPNPRAEDIRPVLYIPESQDASGTTWGRSFQVRTAGNPLALAPAIIKAVAEIDPALPVMDIKTMNQGLDERLDPIRYASLTWTLFGLVGALLTCIGLYGLMSYSIARRTQEIGVRLALGADRFRVVQLVVGQSGRLVAIGLAIGLAASLALNQIIQSLIYGVRLYDPLTMVAVVALMTTVTAVAAYLPARRAARIDPTVALRYE